MSAREWKPGDVARVRYGAVDEVALVRQRPAACHALEFAYVSSGFDMVDDLPPNADVRPLVVIDPEDAEQVERLGKAIYDNGFTASGRLTDALREFANPTPPRPAEPEHIGALATDVDGDTWARHTDGLWTCLNSSPGVDRPRTWADLCARYGPLEVVR